jgi:hypothetical protein
VPVSECEREEMERNVATNHGGLQGTVSANGKGDLGPAHALWRCGGPKVAANQAATWGKSTLRPWSSPSIKERLQARVSLPRRALHCGPRITASQRFFCTNEP